MDMSTFKTMQEAAAAIGSATKYIGAANLELGKVALPAVRSAVGNVPKAVEKTLDQARHGQSADERKHAAVTLGVGVIAVDLASHPTFTQRDDPIGNRHDFRQIGGDHNHRHALFRHIKQHLMDF